MLLKIHPVNPSERHIKTVVECLMDGGIIIYPTDTVYGLGCDITKPRAVEKVAKIKGIDLRKANFSILCHNLSHLSDYAFHVDTPVYKVMKKALPGPFTFILRASPAVPKLFQSKKKTVGIRVPDNKICRMIVEQLGNPLMSTSIKEDGAIIEYTTNPDFIYEKYQNIADIVIDGGPGNNVASTIVDCSEGDFTIVREGLGDIDQFI